MSAAGRDDKAGQDQARRGTGDFGNDSLPKAPAEVFLMEKKPIYFFFKEKK